MNHYRYSLEPAPTTYCTRWAVSGRGVAIATHCLLTGHFGDDGPHFYCLSPSLSPSLSLPPYNLPTGDSDAPGA